MACPACLVGISGVGDTPPTKGDTFALWFIGIGTAAFTYVVYRGMSPKRYVNNRRRKRRCTGRKGSCGCGCS